MSNQIQIGSSHQAKRAQAIVVQASDSGALMVLIPYRLTDAEGSGVHSVCIGTKDGSPQEKAIEGLRDVFGWDTANPFDLQRMTIPDGDEPEFVLADYYADTYKDKSGKDKTSYKFRWLNTLDGGLKQTPPDEEAEAMKRWGNRFSIGAKNVAVVTPPPTTATEVAKPKRALPTKSAKPRTSSSEGVMELLCKKLGVDPSNEAEVQSKVADTFFAANDELFGVGKLAETPEQWGQVADKLGL